MSDLNWIKIPPEMFNKLLHLYKPEEISQWLTSPNELLGGRTAEELINEGREDEVMAVIERLESGVYI